MKTCPYCRQHKNYIETLEMVRYHHICGYMEKDNEQDEWFWYGFRQLFYEEGFNK